MSNASILVATDLTGAARQMYPWAVAFSRAFDAPLTLLHVDEAADSTLGDLTAFSDYLDMLASLRAGRLGQVEDDFARLGTAIGVAVEPGLARRAVVTWARDHDVGLVIVAKHATRDGAYLPLASTIYRVLRAVDVPTLVVPVFEEEADAAPPATVPSPRRLWLPLDVRDEDPRAASAPHDLAKRLDARLTLVHVLDWPRLLPLFPGEAPIGLPLGRVDHVRDHAAERLAQLASDIDPDRVDALVTLGDPAAEALLRDAQEQDVDLLLVPSRGKGRLKRLFVGSFTEALVKRTSLPVMVMPPAFLDSWTLTGHRRSPEGWGMPIGPLAS